mgnify:CR=1 FL=1
MNKYESMTWEELRELPSEEFYKIPKTYLDQAVTEYYERVPPEESEIFVDDYISVSYTHLTLPTNSRV